MKKKEKEKVQRHKSHVAQASLELAVQQRLTEGVLSLPPQMLGLQVQTQLGEKITELLQ